MKSNNELPITQEILTSSLNLYYLYATLREAMKWYETNMSSGITNFEIDETKLPMIPQLHSISGLTYMKFYRSAKSFFHNGLMRSNYVCLMPITTWDALMAKCAKIENVKERSTAVRVFLYIYFYSMWTTQGYSHSREQIVAELHINRARFSAVIKWLEDEALIIRTNYDKTNKLARIYDVPQDLWTEQRIRFEQNREKTRSFYTKNEQTSGLS